MTVECWGAGTTVYTDGSLQLEEKLGGSAAILMSGPAGRESVIGGRAVRVRGASSSTEVEIKALSLAVELVSEGAGAGRVLLVCDSRAALESLRVPRMGEDEQVSTLRSAILGLGREVRLQWVPGHCGLWGNEVADKVSKVVAGEVNDVTADGVRVMVETNDGVFMHVGPAGAAEWLEREDVTRNVGVVVDAAGDGADADVIGRVEIDEDVVVFERYKSVVSHIKRVLSDPPPSHPRVRAVYCPASPWGSEISERANPSSSISSGHANLRSCLTRREEVLLAQLRTGHCHALAAYRALYTPGLDATCPFCFQAPQTVEHWFRDCDALASTRMRTLGTAVPSLDVMALSPVAVMSYAWASILRRSRR